jgi:hypothetical protein
MKKKFPGKAAFLVGSLMALSLISGFSTSSLAAAPDNIKFGHVAPPFMVNQKVPKPLPPM